MSPRAIYPVLIAVERRSIVLMPRPMMIFLPARIRLCLLEMRQSRFAGIVTGENRINPPAETIREKST